MKYTPWPYQRFAYEHLIRLHEAGLFLDMGLGKTVITMTVINDLKYKFASCNKVLVIAPKRVTEKVWVEERDKWDHLKSLRISQVIGTARQRIKALNVDADIYQISRDNIAWLVTLYNYRWPFDMIVVDESSSFKAHDSQRFKAIKKILDWSYRKIILTGTPAPNSLIELWPQLFILDKGERLGQNITTFRKSLFFPEQSNGHHIFKYGLQPGAEKKIYKLIGDICISMEAKDYLKLPKLIERVHAIKLPGNVHAAYKKFEQEKIAEIADKEITAINAAALSNKLLQYSSGFVYDENKEAHLTHILKLEAVEELIEQANGYPVLLAYWFKEDLLRLQKRFRHLKPRLLKTSAEIDAWNRQEIQLALLHPASAGHGLNLQKGGHFIIWYGPIWSAELKLQFVKRLHRQGQEHPVISYTIAVNGTIEIDVMEAQARKISTQQALIDAVRARVTAYKKKRFFG
jgi:SNF2 family DNA or RNA helicase